MEETFPREIDDLRRLCIFPKIWTQETSRPFAIYWSSAANHGCLYPSPTPDELEGFYRSDHYDSYLSGKGGLQHFDAPQTLPYKILVKIAYLADRSTSDPSRTLFRLAVTKPVLCDLGCGGGTFLQSVSNKCASAVGIDPSEVSAAAVQGRGIEFHQGTADHLPADLPRGVFDVVTMLHSLEHVRDVAQSLANVHALLKPNGVALIEVPNMDCVGFRTYPEVWIHTDAGRHLQFFTPQSLQIALECAGFGVIKTEYTGFTHQFLATRVRKMQVHWDVLFADGALKPVSPRASFSTASLHLLRALLGPRRTKYDIVRIYARKL